MAFTVLEPETDLGLIYLETLTLGNPAAFYDSRETLILSIFSKVLTIMWFCNKFTILLNFQRH